MKLSSIELQNYTVIRDLRVDFDPAAQIITLCARNGKGKSSLLDAIGAGLAHQRGKSTWGGTDNITHGQEQAKTTLRFLTKNGEGVTTSRIYNRKGANKTSLQYKDNPPVTHVDKIREELQRLLQEDPEVFLPLMIATQGDIPALLCEDAAIRERRFLSLLRMDPVLEAVEKIRQVSLTVTADTSLPMLVQEAETTLVAKEENTKQLKEKLESLQKEITELTPYAQAVEAWQKFQEKTTLRQQLAWKLEAAKTALEQAKKEAAAILNGTTVEELATRLDQAERKLAAAEAGVALQTAAHLATTFLKEKEEEDRERADLEKAGINLEDKKTALTAKQAELNQLNTKTTNLAIQSSRLEVATNEIAGLEQNVPPAVDPQEITAQQAKLTDVTRQVQQIETANANLEAKNKQFQTEWEKFLKVNTDLASPDLENIEATERAWEDSKRRDVSLQLIDTTLSIWGQPSARCPISQVQLREEDSEARQLAQAERDRLAALHGVVDPKPLRARLTSLTAQRDQINQTCEQLSRDIETATKTATPEKLPTLVAEKVQLETALNKLTRDQTVYEERQRAIKTKRDDLAKLTLLVTQERGVLKDAPQKKLELDASIKELQESIGAIQVRATRHATLTNKRAQERPMIELHKTKLAEWELWQTTQPLSLLQEIPLLKTELTAVRELATRAKDATTRQVNAQIEFTLAETNHAREPAPTQPTLPLDEAQSKTNSLRQKEGEVQQLTETTQKAVTEMEATRQRLVDLKLRESIEARKIVVKTALDRAGELLNYKNLPRKVVEKEFSTIINATNAVLQEIGFKGKIFHLDFAVGAQLYKEDLGMIRTTNIKKLSGGEKTMVGIAMRIAAQKHLSPNIHCLILDEPTTHLDQENVELLAKFFTMLKGKLQSWGVEQLIIVDHHPRLQDVADQIVTW